MNKEQLKSLVIKTIDENRENIKNRSRNIQNPEYGYKEFKTTEAVSNF